MLLKYIIRPALEPQYCVKRADQDPKPGSITDQLIVDIEAADLIVADLSNLNPNAFYELGAAHARGKKVIHVCDNNTLLPFDIRDYRSVFFDPMDPDQHDDTIKKLKAAADELAREKRLLNPISRAIGRHEAIRKEDVRQVSIERLFRDVDELKRRMEDIEHRLSADVMATAESQSKGTFLEYLEHIPIAWNRRL